MNTPPNPAALQELMRLADEYAEQERTQHNYSDKRRSDNARAALESALTAALASTSAGQASWHFHDSQAHLFAGLPPYAGTWDGHTTEEKYDRIAALASPPQPPAASMGHQAAQGQAESSIPAGVGEALQRMIENTAVMGPASREDAMLVARHRATLFAIAPLQPETQARAVALEEAIQACEDETLIQPTGEADDAAYNMAIRDCIKAIRKLAAIHAAKPQEKAE